MVDGCLRKSWRRHRATNESAKLPAGCREGCIARLRLPCSHLSRPASGLSDVNVAEMIHTIAFGVFQRRTIDPNYPPAAAINMLMDCIDTAIDHLQREAG